MSTAQNENSIQRAASYAAHEDYKALLKDGLDRISRYSGDVWTNYNDADPGVTVLQNLCYALTELGYKAGLPIRDVLTHQDGKVRYEQHFHTPRQILPVHPITLNDFRKVLLNAMPELKQVYITPVQCAGTWSCLQTCLEVKPGYAAPETVKYLVEKSALLLHQQNNLTHLFTVPQVLKPVALKFAGTIALEKTTTPEKILAAIMMTVNNTLSPYPRYHGYSQLIREGASMDALLEGPFLSGGYIDDADLAIKRTQVTSDEIGAAMVTIPGVEYLTDLAFVAADHTTPVKTITVDFDEAPYVSLEGFKDVQFLVNGNAGVQYDVKKVQYYLDQLIPVQQEYDDLDALLPHGEHHDISRYYSIQHNFPAVYQLVGKGSPDRSRNARIKQLKAYLSLFEQLMADYLAQLSHTDKIFSFTSGRTNDQVVSHTYFNQPLYQVPGIERVLKGVKGHSIKTGTGTFTDWVSYQQDDTNPYVQQLGQASCTRQGDLERKARVLEHLLARYSRHYDPQVLQLTNPVYNDNHIAEITHLSDTLNRFPLLSANRARSYFKAASEAFPVTGMELNLENELGLRHYYQGICESIQQGFLNRAGVTILYYTEGSAIVVYPSGKAIQDNRQDTAKKGLVEVYWNDNLLLSFYPEVAPSYPMTSAQAEKYVDPYIDTLVSLYRPHGGFVMIDHNRLLEFLTFRWKLLGDDKSELYVSPAITIDELASNVGFIQGDRPLQMSRSADGTFEIGIVSNQGWYPVCRQIQKEADAQAVLGQLQKVRAHFSAEVFSIVILHENEMITFPNVLFTDRITAFFPEWVSLFAQEQYRELLSRKFLAASPAAAQCEIYFPSLEEFAPLLHVYRQWMKGVESLCNGQAPDTGSSTAAWNLVRYLTICYDDVQP